MTLGELRANGQFRQMPISQQLQVAQDLWGRELVKNPAFATLPREEQTRLLTRLTLDSPTFRDEKLGQYVRGLGVNFYDRAPGSEIYKAGYEVLESTIKSSGVVGLISGIFGGAGRETRQEDRVRSLEYLKAVSSVAGASDTWQGVGDLLGLGGDILAVNLAMAPAVGIAAKAIQGAARGIKAGTTLKMSAEAVKAAPILKPALAFFGPVAAETAIEAVPYFFVEDSRRRATGQTPLMEGSVKDVAATFGMYAAADFLTGTVATAILHYGGRALREVFKKPRYAEAVYKSEEEFAKLLYEDPNMVLAHTLPEITQDRLDMSRLMRVFVREGATDPEKYLKPRAAFLANDLGRIWGVTPDFQYRVWREAANGRPIADLYGSFTDLENDLAFDFYQKYKKLDPSVRTTKIRPENSWAYQRGELLYNQASRLDPTAWESLDPELASLWPKKPVPPHRRLAITPAEANAIKASAGDTTVIMADTVFDTNNLTNSVYHEYDLWRSKPVVNVKEGANPNTLFVGQRRAPLEVYEATRKEAQAAMALNGFENPDDAVASLMLNKGFDHVKLADGTYDFFSTRGSRLIATPADVYESTRKPVWSGSAATTVSVQTVSKRLLKGDEFGRQPVVISAAVTKAVRSSDPQNVRDLARYYTGTSAVDQYVNVVQGTGTSIAVRATGKNVTFYMPKHGATTSFKDEVRGVEALVKGLEKASQAVGTRAKYLPESTYIIKRILESPEKLGFTDAMDPKPWISATARNLGGSFAKEGDSWLLTLPSGTASFPDLKAARLHLERVVADPSAIAHDLSMQGIRIIKTPQGATQLRSRMNGDILAVGTDLPDVLQQIAYEPSKISSRFGPTNLRYTRQGIEYQVGDVRVFQNQSQAQKFIAKFQDGPESSQGTLYRVNASGEVYQTPPRQYVVHLNQYGVTRKFNNPGDAIKYLSDDAKSLDELSDIAHRKGLTLTVDARNNFVVRANDGVHRAADSEELKAVFREYPDLQQSVRSVFDDIDPSIESDLTVRDLVARFRDNRPLAGMNDFGLPPEFAFPERAPVKAFTSLLKSTEQTTFVIEKIAADTKDPTLLKLYRSVEYGARAAEVETTKSMRLLAEMFKDDKGNLLSHPARQKIYYHLAQNSEREIESLGQQYVAKTGRALADLTPQEARVAEKVKAYLDEAKIRYGIDYEKLIFHYMPHLRDLADPGNRGVLASMVHADDLFQHKQMSAPELKWWAEFERADDMVSYALKDDALEVMMLYTSQGNKKLFMNDAWRKFNRYLDGAPDANKVDLGVRQRIAEYQETLMSATRTPGEKAIEDFGEKFLVALKHNPVIGPHIKASEVELREKGRNLFRSIMGLTYVSSLGWKPFLAIRNGFQPWSTAAARLGVPWVWDGMEKVLKDPETYYKKHIALGVITDKPPIVNDVLSRLNKFGRIAESSLSWFKNADDLTRSWTYEAAGIRFDNAADAFLEGKIKTREAFDDLSGLDMMEGTFREQVWETLTLKGRELPERIEAARHQFSFKFMEETMFPYRASEAPTVHKGVFGKLFGQFGTYPIAYRDNLARLFMHAPKAKLPAMVATYLATSAALWGTFSAMKIRTTDFIPFAPSFFSGGPTFDMAINALGSFDSGYKGEQARAELKRSLPLLVPGSAQARYLGKFLEEQEKGNYYRALMSLTGASMFPE